MRLKTSNPSGSARGAGTLANVVWDRDRGEEESEAGCGLGLSELTVVVSVPAIDVTIIGPKSHPRTPRACMGIMPLRFETPSKQKRHGQKVKPLTAAAAHSQSLFHHLSFCPRHNPPLATD